MLGPGQLSQFQVPPPVPVPGKLTLHSPWSIHRTTYTPISCPLLYCIECRYLFLNIPFSPTRMWVPSSAQFSCFVMSASLWPHVLQQARLPCPSWTAGACSNSGPSSQWCHPTILSSVIPFSSCLQSFPAPESFPLSQFFASGGQSFGVLALALVLQWIFRTNFL